jgi:hypothetical protein
VLTPVFCVVYVLLFFIVFCVVYFYVFVFVLCFKYPKLPVSLACSFLTARSVFSNVYFGKKVAISLLKVYTTY